KAMLRSLSNAVKGALTGRLALHFEVSPILHYPQMVVARSNLDSAFSYLWDCVGGAALVSATLYSDNKSAKLARWKMAVPPTRAKYLPAVSPSWITSQVQLHDK